MEYFVNNTAKCHDFSRENGLTADGISGCRTWTRLVNEVVGIGRTPTVIDP